MCSSNKIIWCNDFVDVFSASHLRVRRLVEHFTTALGYYADGFRDPHVIELLGSPAFTSIAVDYKYARHIKIQKAYSRRPGTGLHGLLHQ